MHVLILKAYRDGGGALWIRRRLSRSTVETLCRGQTSECCPQESRKSQDITSPATESMQETLLCVKVRYNAILLIYWSDDWRLVSSRDTSGKRWRTLSYSRGAGAPPRLVEAPCVAATGNTSAEGGCSTLSLQSDTCQYCRRNGRHHSSYMVASVHNECL